MEQIDRDPFIFTGMPATPADVLDMLADPDMPITVEVIEHLPPEQRPDPAAIAQVLGQDP